MATCRMAGQSAVSTFQWNPSTSQWETSSPHHTAADVDVATT